MADVIDHFWERDTAKVAKALAQLKRVETFCAAWPQIAEQAGKDIEPDVRAELAVSYDRSGLARNGPTKKKPQPGDEPGSLFAAAVTESTIKANQLGITVYMAAKYPTKVYARAGAFRHGAVYGVSTKSRGNSAKRARKKIKNKLGEALTGTSHLHQSQRKIGGGISVRPPRAIDFYEFNAAQCDRLALSYVNAVNARVVALSGNI